MLFTDSPADASFFDWKTISPAGTGEDDMDIAVERYTSYSWYEYSVVHTHEIPELDNKWYVACHEVTNQGTRYNTLNIHKPQMIMLLASGLFGLFFERMSRKAIIK